MKAGTPSTLTLLALVVILFCLGPFQKVSAQEEASSRISRFMDMEAATGEYGEHEVIPITSRRPIEIKGMVRRGPLGYIHTNEKAHNRGHLADSHWGIPFYDYYTCEECHPDETRSILTTRGGVTCRQCHGPEPIASINHYYSPLNPIRRHAYVCAKCHPGATASFAEYRVHEPLPGKGKDTFPALFYAFWIMVGIAFLTFMLFLPHTFLWGLRELFHRKEKRDDK